MIDKKEFRDKQIRELIAFSKTSRAIYEYQNLYNQLFELEEFRNAKSIGVTLSHGFEMDTNPIIKKALAMGKKVYIPKTYSESKNMDFVYYSGVEELVSSSFGLLEPKDATKVLNSPDLIVVPGLAYTIDSNYRVGFGGGYFDRYLSKHTNNTSVVLANSKQIYSTNLWEIEDHDIAIDIILQPDLEKNNA